MKINLNFLLNIKLIKGKKKFNKNYKTILYIKFKVKIFNIFLCLDQI